MKKVAATNYIKRTTSYEFHVHNYEQSFRSIFLLVLDGTVSPVKVTPLAALKVNMYNRKQVVPPIVAVFFHGGCSPIYLLIFF